MSEQNEIGSDEADDDEGGQGGVGGQSTVSLMQAQREHQLEVGAFDQIALIEMVYQLWWRWADFHVFITVPVIKSLKPPNVIAPACLEESDDLEFVYPIVDYGDRFSTSKALELYSAGLSMCKFYNTIEKMISLMIERLKSVDVGVDSEVQVAFSGHELGQRKGFESVINLSYNVVVTNFDPGVWGERYLQVVKRLAEKGYGYPTAAPRDSYRHIKKPMNAPSSS